MGGPSYQVLALADAGASIEEAGFKAHNLGRMARLGLPVPEGFVLGTSLCRAWLVEPEAAMHEARPAIDAALRELERASGLRFGDPRRPLLVSVRSGGPVSMPGMMDTVLDVGLNRSTLHGLLRLTGNPRLAWDSYRRLIQSFAEVVYGADAAPFREATERALAHEGLSQTRELDFRSHGELAEQFLQLHEALTGKRFPENPRTQLERAIAAVFRSWRNPRASAYRKLHGIAEDVGTAATVQRMVFGNAGGTSGAGVGFTRNPSTGENALYVDFLFNSQGEDVVSGRQRAGDTERLAQVLPDTWSELGAARIALEREFGDAQEFEFTVQEEKLFLLQTRTAKRTSWAALRIAVEQVSEGLIQRPQALERLAKLDLRAIHRARLADENGGEALARAIPAAVGVVSGRIALDPEAVARYARKGEPAILVREDISTADFTAITEACGVLSTRGSRTAHAAVIARQLGKVCLVNCEGLAIDNGERTVRLGGQVFREGDVFSLDANEGRVFAGEVRTVLERPDELLAEVARWRASSEVTV